MKKLYLHIGTEKTGTKSLQNFLCKNEGVLNKHGFSYFCDPKKSYFDNTAHFPIVAYLLSGIQDFISEEKNLVAPKALDELCLDLNNYHHNVILSCEHFSSRIRSIKQLIKLRNKLVNYDIKVVCYIRRQDELALSSYSTGVRGGRRLKLKCSEINVDNDYFNYLTILNRWAKVFGDKNIIVRCYSNKSLINGDIRQDFLELIGIKEFDEFTYEKNLNLALDATQIETLRLINHSLPAFKPSEKKIFDMTQTIRNKLCEYLPKGMPLQKLLNENQRNLIIKKFNRVNQIIEKKFMAPNALSHWNELQNSQMIDSLNSSNSLAQKEYKILQLENELATLYQSRAWQLTQFFRFIFRSLKKLRSFAY